MKKHLVAPSVLAANFGNLEADLKMINQSEADWLHVDIMDGNFVPNISFGPDITKVMSNLCDLPLDVHLMIEQPDHYIDAFVDAGAANIAVHVEATRHLHRSIQLIKSKGVKAGVALNPHTSLNDIEHILEDVDLITIMSVNPGFGGQKFIYQTISKLRQLREMLDTRNLDPYISVDGGVGLQNAEAILQAGANVLITGSSVFKADKPLEAISRLKAFEKNTLES